jgi:hypothetical protein
METKSKRLYEHCRICCYLALLSVGDGKKVSYLQVHPGGGKTWICLLSAKYISETEDKEIVYVVLNEGLKLQVKESAEAAGITVKICLPKEITTYLRIDP